MEHFVFAAIILVVALAYIHYPNGKISDQIKSQILNNGLIHFTTDEFAYSIQKEGLIPGKAKAMYPREKNFVWMYINDSNSFQEKTDEIHKKGHRKKYDTVVTFLEIEEHQIEQMKYRKKDMAIIHRGVFKTVNVSVSTIDCID